MLNNQEFPAKIEYLSTMLGTIRQEISSLVKDTKQLRRLELCSEEILANIIQYAYPNTEGSLFISIKYLEKKHQLCFIFIDNGIPYNPLNEQNEPNKIITLESQPIGGLGIFLYTTIMDKVDYQHLDGKNILTVWKNL